MYKSCCFVENTGLTITTTKLILFLRRIEWIFNQITFVYCGCSSYQLYITVPAGDNQEFVIGYHIFFNTFNAILSNVFMVLVIKCMVLAIYVYHTTAQITLKIVLCRLDITITY